MISFVDGALLQSVELELCITAIGGISIAVFGIAIALIFFQDLVKMSAGLIAGYVQDGQTPVKRNSIESALMGIIFLATGAGVYPWRAGGHQWYLVVCAVLGLGSIGYLAFESFAWKPVVALAVVLSVLVWLRLPVLRYRLSMGSSQ